MNRSISDVLEDYIDSLVNLPSELDEKLKEMHVMDEEFQQHRDAFRSKKRAHLKLLQHDTKLALKASSTESNRSPTTPLPPLPTTATASASVTPESIAASLYLVEKEYMAAIDTEDQKISKAQRLYDRVSLYIERLDFEMVQNNIALGHLCNHNKRQHLHQPSLRYDTSDKYISSFSSSTSTNQHQRPNGTSSSSLHTLAPNNISSYQTTYLAVGSRKNILSSESIGYRKRSVYSERPNPPINTGLLFEQEINPNEPRYCYCSQVSYGDMVACDGENCEKEWFHYSCVGLTESPVGKWFCNGCMADLRRHD